MAFLRVATPTAWFDAAVDDEETLLIDHANCEKKAASTALSLLYRYVERPELVHRLSRLAREELRHFEQVHSLMRRRGIDYRQLSASRYAGELHRWISRGEPERLVDTMLVGAVVEARSYERFIGLADRLDEELAAFYRRLALSEARHYEVYIGFAHEFGAAEGVDVTTRLDGLLAVEATLCCDPDDELRFHSGPPTGIVTRPESTPGDRRSDAR